MVFFCSAYIFPVIHQLLHNQFRCHHLVQLSKVRKATLAHEALKKVKKMKKMKRNTINRCWSGNPHQPKKEPEYSFDFENLMIIFDAYEYPYGGEHYEYPQRFPDTDRASYDYLATISQDYILRQYHFPLTPIIHPCRGIISGKGGFKGSLRVPTRR